MPECIICGKGFTIPLSEEHVTSDDFCSSRCEDDYDRMIESEKVPEDDLITCVRDIGMIAGMRVKKQ